MKVLSEVLIILTILEIYAAQLLKIPLEGVRIEETKISKNGYMRNLEQANSPKQKLSKQSSLYYVGTVKIGNNQQSFSLLFDTTTSISWIPSSYCNSNNNCQGFSNTYNCISSDGCTAGLQLLNQFTYQNGTLTGQSADVQTGLGSLKSIPHNFIQILSISNFTYLKADGVLGMQMFSFYKPNGNSFITNLFKAGNIQNNMFSFYFGSTPQLSIGGFDTSSVQNVSNIYYHNVVMNGQNDNTQQWVVAGSQLVVGNFSQYLFSGYNLVQISTADTYIKVSEDIFVNMMRYFNNSLHVQKQGGQYTLPCSQTFPNFVLYLPDSNGNVQVYNLTSDYFINKQSDTCYLMIADLGYQKTVKIVLGTPFLQKYVSIFSMNNQTIGFSQASLESSDSSSLPGWAIALIIIACIILVALILFFLYKKWQSNKNKDLERDSNGEIITYSKRQSNFNNSNNKANNSSANNISTNLTEMNTSNQVVSSKNQTSGNVTIQTGNFSSTTVSSSKQVVSSQQITTQKIVTSTSTSSKQVTSTSKYDVSNNNNF
ncbi:hypothetical protein ABPG74_012407 [Tetrahymena malaccensis]